ncbi:MAG: glycosyltransferase [Ancalomicrobiaceae bacterium]|nr:glycosyltransferase [Ancalomicrobiaceae bacterium]
MKVAIVHDWLYVLGGAERVLSEILKCYPEADVFALFDILDESARNEIGLKKVQTSFLQNMPLIKSHHRLYLPLMPLAIEQFDLTSYDLVISSSYAVAHGVITGPDQIHIAYIHSPMRYAWDLQHSYLRQSGKSRGLSSLVARWILHHMRIWDVRTAHGPDAIASNSQFVARRIRKCYGRKATVIHPPVSLTQSPPLRQRGEHFLAASRLVPYKNIDLIVRAFAQMPDLKLIVAGSGPEAARLKRMAGPNVTFAGWLSNEDLRSLMASARAFVFASEEDFGIIPVEALSEGTPVIAYGRGGVLETVRAVDPDRTGLFFAEQTEDSLIDGVRRFIASESRFSRMACRKQAETFSAEVFRKKFVTFVESHMPGNRAALGLPRPDLEDTVQLCTGTD